MPRHITLAPVGAPVGATGLHGRPGGCIIAGVPTPRSADGPGIVARVTLTQLFLRPWRRVPRLQLLHGSSLLLASLSVYTLTLYPSIPGGDSGELVAGVCDVGVVHPPGYPLYVLLGQLFKFLPFYTMAWRMNFLSALLQSGTVTLFYGLLVTALRAPWAAFLGAGLLAFSPIFWHHATGAEVFPLHNLLVVCLLLCAVVFHRTREPRWGWATALVFGLGLSNHHTILFFGAPLAVWLGWRCLGERRSEPAARVRCLAALAACFLVGLLPYIYLPLAAARTPVIFWGQADSWGGFVHHVLRRDYGTWQLAAGKGRGDGLLIYLYHYCVSLARQTLWCGPVAALWGVVQTLKHRKKSNLACARAEIGFSVGLYFFYVVVFHGLSNYSFADQTVHEVIARFWMQPNLLVFGWVAVAFAVVEKRYLGARRQLLYGRVAVVTLVALQLGLHFSANNQRHNNVVANFGRALLVGLPPQAIVFTMGDLFFNPVRYWQRCEKLRLDVALMDRAMLTHAWTRRLVQKNYPQMQLPDGLYMYPQGYPIQDLVLRHVKKFPVFLGDRNPVNEQSQSFQFPGHTLRPFGLLNQVVDVATPFSPPEYDEQTKVAFDQLQADVTAISGSVPWDNVVRVFFWDKMNERGLTLVEYGAAHRDSTALRLGTETWETLVTHVPDLAPHVFKNLAIAYTQWMQLEPERQAALKRVAAGHWRTYLAKIKPTDPDYPLVVQALANLQE